MQLKIEDRFLDEVAKKDLKDLKGKIPYPIEVLKIFKRRVSDILDVENSAELRQFKSLHFEKLKEAKYQGKYSIRLNKAYRMIFRIENNEISNLEIILVEEINNHYS
jgi:plasmid maintenance system killer protein